jgi:hypothetical protein
MYVAGNNANGEFGFGSTTPANSMVLMASNTGALDPSIGKVKTAAAHGSHNIATIQFGTDDTSPHYVHTWGLNADGQLGTNDIATRMSPTMVAGDLSSANVVAVFASDKASFAIGEQCLDRIASS